MTCGEQGRLRKSCHPAPIQTHVGEAVMARDRLGPGPTWKRTKATPVAQAGTRPRPLQAAWKGPGPGRKDQGGTRMYINHWFCMYIRLGGEGRRRGANIGVGGQICMKCPYVCTDIMHIYVNDVPTYPSIDSVCCSCWTSRHVFT